MSGSAVVAGQEDIDPDDLEDGDLERDLVELFRPDRRLQRRRVQPTISLPEKN